MANTTVQIKEGSQSVLTELDSTYPLIRAFLVTLKTEVIKSIFTRELFDIAISVLDKIFQYTPPTITTSAAVPPTVTTT